MSNRSIATVATTGSERAIRRLIALIVLCCDPLAIALTAAASARRSTDRSLAHHPRGVRLCRRVFRLPSWQGSAGY
jgi:hypothetical protein